MFLRVLQTVFTFDVTETLFQVNISYHVFTFSISKGRKYKH